MDSLGTSNKAPTQFYKLQLTDYALPSFCSGGTSYYGTLEDIKTFVQAMRKVSEHDADGLEKALAAFLAGEQSVMHPVGYAQEPFLVAVEFVESKVQKLKNYKWTHINIWGFPYYMKSDEGTIQEVILKDGETYVLCAKVEFKNLMHRTDPPCDRWMKNGDGFWGFPGLLRYKKTEDLTFSDLYFVESFSQELKDEMAQIGKTENLNLKNFCDSIFGDG